MPLIPSWARRLSWQTVAFSLVVGGIVHIAATLVVPRLATASAYHRLSGALPVNRMLVLPAASADNQLLPFLGPDLRLAVCRYDVSQGPIAITAVLPDKGWSLGLYTRSGDNFYAIPAQDFRRSDVKFTLVPPAERFLGIFNWGRTADATASQISVPQAEGLVVIRAPMRGRVYQSDVEQVLARAQCQPQQAS